jgi:hypothetical protein
MIITKTADIISHPEKNVRQLMAGGQGPLTVLIRTVQGLSSVELKVKALLAAPLKDQLKIVKFQQGILILSATSAAWATQAKFQTSDLLAALRKDRAFAGLMSIQIKVDPGFSSMTTKVDEKKLTMERIMPKQAASTITELADKIVHEELRKALLGLADNRN